MAANKLTVLVVTADVDRGWKRQKSSTGTTYMMVKEREQRIQNVQRGMEREDIPETSVPETDDEQ